MAAKSYSNYTPADIKALGLKMQEGQFVDTLPLLNPSDFLLQILANNKGLPLFTEKAKSEFIIAPILNEIRRRNVDKTTFFSGHTFNIDAKRGLNGRCDFIFTLNATALSIDAPLFCVIEAKNDTPDDENNFAQCIAEMYAAQLFNEKHQNTQITTIYGAVSNGYDWIFIKLTKNIATVDTNKRYYANNLPELLGVLQYIIDQY